MAIRFPVLDSLDLDDYGLFPGPPSSAVRGFHERFDSGLTLLLGTNGLGKTTLVSILYRLLTGPTDIPILLEEGRSLGTASLVPRTLQAPQRRTFARRVADNAQQARARLRLHIGSSKVVIERRLQNLSLLSFSIDGRALATDDEERSFQRSIPELVGVGTFADWILLLRHLVFYFEDRRSLVWDPSAQRQLLRLLFLPTEVAGDWTRREREILQLDSDKRNLQNVLGRQEAQLAGKETQLGARPATVEELTAVQALKDVQLERQSSLEAELTALDADRQAARLRFMRAEQERDSKYREYEHAKLLAIETRFPQQSDTAKFIYAHLMTSGSCLVCGNRAERAAALLNERIEHDRCVVCDTQLAAPPALTPARKMADKRVGRELQALDVAEREAQFAGEELRTLEKTYAAKLGQLYQVNHDLAEADARHHELEMLLPPSETSLREQRSTLGSMRAQVREMDAQQKRLRDAFKEFVDRVSLDLTRGAQQVVSTFDAFGKSFMAENCRLTWTTVEAPLGQSGGARIGFPAFQVDLSGADFSTPVRRSGPEQVSESQREFIDLAFRMALMTTAGGGGGTSMVIDTPEASLDAVFTPRAADVLVRFARASRNRLLIASNLVEGGLIPMLIRLGIAARRPPKIVNLLQLATPTAAVRQHREDYDRVFAKMTRRRVSRGR